MSMFSLMCHICIHVPCFPNATKATQISGPSHFQICLPAPSSNCFFYQRPPARPWLRGHKYCQLSCVECCCFLNSHFEFRLEPSIAADLSIRASSFEGAPLIWGWGLIIRFCTSNRYCWDLSIRASSFEGVPLIWGWELIIRFSRSNIYCWELRALFEVSWKIRW